MHKIRNLDKLQSLMSFLDLCRDRQLTSSRGRAFSCRASKRGKHFARGKHLLAAQAND